MGRSQKLKVFKEDVMLNWNFQGVGGGGSVRVQTKNLPWVECELFLEQHVSFQS